MIQIKAEHEVYGAIRNVADELNSLFENKFSSQNPAVFLTVLDGGIYFTGRIMNLIQFPSVWGSVSYRRYGKEDATLTEPTVSVSYKEVILLDDIFDEGVTLQKLSEMLLQLGATRVWTVCLFKKQKMVPTQEIGPDFYGDSVPDKFVFGSGMDRKDGHCRQLAGLHYEV